MTSLIATLLAAAAVTSTPPADAVCDVEVVFGSYAMGIDARAFERVETWIDRHPGLVSGSTTAAWGREGEQTLCLTTGSRRDTARVFASLKGLIQGRARRGPTQITTRQGQVWRSHPAIVR